LIVCSSSTIRAACRADLTHMIMVGAWFPPDLVHMIKGYPGSGASGGSPAPPTRCPGSSVCPPQVAAFGIEQKPHTTPADPGESDLLDRLQSIASRRGAHGRWAAQRGRGPTRRADVAGRAPAGDGRAHPGRKIC
jgi:hypothetical protein